MLKRVFAMSLVVVMCSATGFAQNGPDPGAPQDFATVKARMTARLQEELACVQAATTLEALRACRPQRPEGRGGPPQGR
jgi:hypothetical protein